MKSKFIKLTMCAAFLSLLSAVNAQETSVSTKSDAQSGTKAAPSALNTELKPAPEKAEAKTSANSGNSGGTVGGNFKFYLYDKSEGVTNGSASSERALTGMTSFYMFINKDLSENVSLEIDPEISVSGGATPKLGAAFPSPSTSPTLSLGLLKAQITVKLPESVELTAGSLRTLFTEDYGNMLWYEDEFFGNYAVCGGYYGTLDDTGIELYKNFELGPVSLPSYLYILGGGMNMLVSNTNSRGFLAHITPEIGPFKFMGSYFSTMDVSGNNPINRYSAGVAFNYDAFMFRSEYMGGTWNNVKMYANTDINDATQVTRNLTPHSYYMKAGYKILPWVRFLMVYAHYDQDFSSLPKSAAVIGGGATAAANKQSFAYETYTELSPILNFYVTPDSIIYLQVINVENSSISLLPSAAYSTAELNYNRLVVGWRTTF